MNRDQSEESRRAQELAALLQAGRDFFRAGRRMEALAHAEQAIAGAPKAGAAWNLLGVCRAAFGDLPAAREAFARAVVLAPADPSPSANLARLCWQEQRWTEGLQHATRALGLDPDHREALNNQGILLMEDGQPTRAILSFQRLRQLDPARRAGLANEARARAMLGDSIALQIYQDLLTNGPEDGVAASNYLYALTAFSGVLPDMAAEAHRMIGRRIEASRTRFAPRERSRPARIKVGFVSPDLREHPVACFLEPLFRAYDRERFAFHAYADVIRPDERTAMLRGLIDRWIDLRGKTDLEAAMTIAHDAPDILVDLAGHTAGNRLHVFALRPAPVQATWLGYPNTTGLCTIDYRITDAAADPPGTTESWHTEKLIRLTDCAWCYARPAKAPAVSSPPAQTTGHVTFCSLNNPAKISTHTLELWGRTLQAVPDSRLILKGRTLADPGLRGRLVDGLGAFDVSPARLELRDWTPRTEDHFATYHAADVALDTFPYHGTTTTCDALWMGVPVLVRAGETHAARVGVSLLRAAGLDEFVATTDDEYVTLAVRLANDPVRLADLRSRLRPRLTESVLMDGLRFARNFAEVCEQMFNGAKTTR